MSYEETVAAMKNILSKYGSNFGYEENSFSELEEKVFLTPAPFEMIFDVQCLIIRYQQTEHDEPDPRKWSRYKILVERTRIHHSSPEFIQDEIERLRGDGLSQTEIFNRINARFQT